MSAPGYCTLTIATPPGLVSQPSSSTTRSFLAGNMIRFLMSFTDVAGTLTDPTTVTASVGTSYADEVSLTAVMDSTGKWHADWDSSSADEATYYCVVSGTGTLQVEAEIPISIKVSHL